MAEEIAAASTPESLAAERAKAEEAKAEAAAKAAAEWAVRKLRIVVSVVAGEGAGQLHAHARMHVRSFAAHALPIFFTSRRTCELASCCILHLCTRVRIEACLHPGHSFAFPNARTRATRESQRRFALCWRVSYSCVRLARLLDVVLHSADV